MVVTRRGQAPPVPPTSRTTSTQNTPRVSRPKPQATQQLAVDSQGTKAQSGRQKTPPQTHQNGGHDERRKMGRRSPQFSSFTFLIFAIFSLYALSTLHPSPAQSFRNAFSVPHDNLMKPYIVSPFRAALSHPIVEPHVTNIRTTLQPYAQHVEHTTRPILERFSHLEEKHLRPFIRRSTIATILVIQKIWHRIVVPNYNIYFRPHIQPHLDRCSSFYYRRIEPRLRAFSVEITLRYYKVKPRVDNAWRIVRRYSTTAYSKITAHLQRAYRAVKPRAATLWVKARPHLWATYKVLKSQAIKGWSILRTCASVATTYMGDARRKFVDPHIKRIWEKVESRSSASGNMTNLSISSISEATSTTFTTPSDITTTTAAETTIAFFTEAAAPSSVLTASAAEPSTEQVNTPVSDTALASAASDIFETIGLGAAANDKDDDQTLLDLPSNSATSRVVSSGPELAQATATTTLDQSTAAPSRTPAVSDSVEDDSVDDFLQELGISSSEQLNASESTPTESNDAATQHTFSVVSEEESAAAFRAKVAAKRAAIVERHENWEVQMDEAVKIRERALRTDLVSMRKKAVDELKELTVRSGPEDRGEKVVDSIEHEANRLAKGIEGYIKKERDQKERVEAEWYDQLDDKKSQWEKVLDKVHAKFSEKINIVQEAVHGWYLGAREKEGDEVLMASSELRSLADSAQADLGLDYAWLEDVTYEDWQKYHDLMRASDRFEQEARAIQNGTHAHPPVDPLGPAVEALQRGVQDLINGFEARLSLLRSEGNDLYRKAEPGNLSSPAQSSTLSEPTMSILPISGDAQDPILEASNIVLSKSEEQIKQALGAAGFDVNGRGEARAGERVEL